MPENEQPTLEEVLGAKHAWYHTIDLAPGVSTPGWIDLRRHVDAPQIPTSLHGLRALDVGTFDGFWAFELERRGADVVAIDVDQIPPPDTPRGRWEEVQRELEGKVPGTGFALLRRWFGSSVDRRSVNVYDLTPDLVGGPVDLAFLGAMLLHLRDPVGALERIRETLRPGGQLVLFEPVDRKLSKSSDPMARLLIGDNLWTWWYANRACMADWVRTAGFTDVQDLGTRDVVDSTGGDQRHVVLHARA